MSEVVLLGPQGPAANVRAALEALGIAGRVCVVTAGWQEREGELDSLREAIDNPISDLALYARCEEAFAQDHGLFDAHRERQDTLIALQRFYRVRLSHGLAATRDLATAEGPEAPRAAAWRTSISALRSLDRYHLRQLRRAHADFQARCPLIRCQVLVRHREAMRREIEGCEAVLIAGGHVAVLLGRLRLLDFAELVADRALIAWSAGAMAVADRVVLFHDHPPQGAGDPEVLDAGLGLAPRIVALPNARERLALDDTRRVAIFARRFSPAHSLTLDAGAMLRCTGGRIVGAAGVSRLTGGGRVVEVRAP